MPQEKDNERRVGGISQYSRDPLTKGNKERNYTVFTHPRLIEKKTDTDPLAGEEKVFERSAVAMRAKTNKQTNNKATWKGGR